MNLPILFQSLSRIVGKERRSKLLHNESELYAFLHQIKALVSTHYALGADRMDLHIELTKNSEDADLDRKAQSLQGQSVRTDLIENWSFLGRAFVLWTPEVAEYGKTHITVAFFGDTPKPDLATLWALIREGYAPSNPA